MSNRLTEWLTENLTNWLKTKGGCEVITHNIVGDTTKIVVRDIFGQSYEVQIKALTRTTGVNDDDFSKTLKFNFAGMSYDKRLI